VRLVAAAVATVVNQDQPVRPRERLNHTPGTRRGYWIAEAVEDYDRRDVTGVIFEVNPAAIVGVLRERHRI
jgi:hypothetical protein